MNLEMRDKKPISDVRMDKAREFLSDAQANYPAGVWSGKKSTNQGDN